MIRVLLICLTVLPFYIQNAQANNTSIAYVKWPLNQCQYIFRDTVGTRTFTPTSYFWDFGDGHTSTQQHAIHDYLVNDTYTIKHYITDGINTDSAVFTLIVNCLCNFQLDAYLFGADILPPKVQFKGSYIGRPIRFFWDFGDGDTSNLQSPYHEYNTNYIRHYTIKFIIWDSTSSDTAIHTYLVGPYSECNSPKADFTYEIDTSECGLVKFTETCATPILHRYWYFGDPTHSNQKDPVHYYHAMIPTIFKVTLVVWDSVCVDTASKYIEVKCRDCYTSTAVINMQVDPNDSSKAILYNNSQGVIKSHFWDFGDGNTSTLSSPTHTYTKAGKIRLKYVCTDTFNCKDSTYLFFEIDSNGHIKRGNVSFTINVVNNTNYTSLENTSKIYRPEFYPQPALDFLHIQLNKLSVSTIRIYNLLGEMISTSTTDVNGQTTIQTSDWASGIYMVQLEDGTCYKILKQ